ncbi:winged helix-turn-helix domain-containing protein [Acidimicrobiia bacterium EGI L10123]|uniref:BTAD domain-containing putative transcriptional regulator n=1 Tax=Salinilacustrithrix flava TaxID=2957203 RepID=UPI003D7C353D|nr:winged helix-turn-helix domain-containing protein [Acidimicrobiia bacterium EGI L10123]
MNGIAVEVLGPLRVRDAAGGDVTPRGRLQRRLLAFLTLRGGAVVSVDQLTEVLWPDRLPTGAASLVHSHIFRLRQHIPDIELDATPPGYVLRLPEGAVDAARFERAVARAAAERAGDPEGALGALDGALGSWRGEAFEDLVDLDAGRIEAERLEELRLRALEERFAALLDLGRGAAAVADLEALVAREPLRERPRELLMDALVASGRRADALRVYDAYRRQLAEELGVEPSAHLRSAHERLLHGDPVPQQQPATGAPVMARPLPRPVSSFVGREQLLGVLAEHVQHERLITLVGPGGIGKTRLVTELCHLVVDSFPDGARFCDLTAVVDDDGVPAAVAAAVGVEDRPGVSTIERVAEVVRHERSLLVLDNCEHVLDGVACVADVLLRSTERLVLLATSRERIAVDGERLFPVDPLGASGEESPAVLLFADRATAASPSFALDDRTRPLVVDLCQRLDGLPLAIELAASRLASLSLEEVIAGLAHSTAVLRGGPRAVPRHRSLDAALTWSHRMLDADDQLVLAAAATFAGPFDGEDVAAVADRDASDVRDRLADLVERSLVHRDDGRFRLLQVVRSFLAERSDDRQRGDLARRHADRIAARVSAASAALRTAHDDAPMQAVRALVPDLRQAMATASARRDPDLAVRIVVAIRDPAMHGMLPELMAWGEAAGDLGAAAGHPLAVDAYAVAALGAWKAGDLERMGHLLDRAEEAAADLGLAPTYELIGARATESLAHGALADAVEGFRAGLRLDDAVGDPLRQGEDGATLAIAESYAHAPGAVADAERLLDDVAPGAGAIAAAWCWYGAGEVLLDDDPPEARRRLRRAVELARAGGGQLVEGVAGASLASLDARAGDVPAAVGHYRWLLPLWLRAGVRSPFRTMLRTVTELLCGQGLDDQAALLLGAVTAPGAGHEVVGDDVDRLAAVRAELEQRLGPGRLAELLAEGAALDDAAAAGVATAAFDRIEG